MSKLAARWAASLLLLAGVGTQVGCRACGSCHDYSSPVADCQCESCNNCGGGRAGSAMTGYYAQQQDPIDDALQFAEQPADDAAPVRR